MTDHNKTLDQYFCDWEGNAFGFGYGSGEQHIIPHLRTFFALCRGENFSYDYSEAETELGGPVTWFLINALCWHGVDSIEYGTSPRFGWLTRSGRAVREFMLSRASDDLIRLVTSSSYGDSPCYPDCCNCGDSGYDAKRVCPNPFWQRRS